MSKRFVAALSAILCIVFVSQVQADTANPISFVVADVHFGDSSAKVLNVATKLGMTLKSEMNYNPQGDFGVSLASQTFSRPAAKYQVEELTVQYSRTSTVVVGIDRRLPIDPLVNTSVVRESVVARFGKQVTAKPFGGFDQLGIFHYAWTRAGEQIQQAAKCDLNGIPVRNAQPDCGLAATVSMQTVQNNAYVNYETITVFDWAKHFDELSVAAKSEVSQKEGHLDKNKSRAAPKL